MLPPTNVVYVLYSDNPPPTVQTLSSTAVSIWVLGKSNSMSLLKMNMYTQRKYISEVLELKRILLLKLFYCP